MKKTILLALLLISSVGFTQKIKVVKGDFKFLSSEKNVNVEFNYSNLLLMKENMTESKYVENRKNELNEKTRGVGDSWARKWEGAKDGIWQPKFLELMAATVSKEKDIVFQEDLKDTKYTLLVDVVWIYPGWDVAMMKQPAKVSVNLKIVDSKNKNNVLVEVNSENAPGDQWGSNFSNESRIGEGFAKTGKSFGKMISKDLK
ncbi:hypothetical protein [Flavobacterium aciduliphilum]|uniref:Uncharacterized protein n=1 Tax=Flavobacterium aciduliphilum TaxID=1101402 RepID=A0A328YC14_9FLAO|nr:hypothetical protein [Flavobacterium aciduliphilum]RAR71508.1 hypothetical protein CLV55_10764 [Flavobacterium aciduliphilum]